ncbi:MAG: hypothetical protein M1165_00390 [Candidatus Pacearchaeota archaeon]|nr:hypothetical protein [Candidatus Pacearchaeota archaeon]MDE1848428.1 hypothetical protein [Nanoarchaeota archaeon]
MRFLVNKRGDISITILVIGVFAVCALAIFSFLIYRQQAAGNFANVDIITNLSKSLSDFYFYVDTGMSASQAAQLVGGQLKDGGNTLVLYGEQDASNLPLINNNPQRILSASYSVDISKRSP